MSGISDNRRMTDLKVVLAAALVFAQLAASAHAHHEHSDHDESDSGVQCAACIVKSSSDDDGDLTTADSPPAATLDVASPIAVAIRSDSSASSVRGRRTARGPPLS